MNEVFINLRQFSVSLPTKLISALVVTSVAMASAVVHAQSSTPDEEQKVNALEEIIVTATKRAKNLQDVPISIGVVTGEFIDKFDVKDLSDFQSYVPGLQIQSTFGSWAVRVRGLGSGITNLAFDSSVPIYVDGMYCGRGKCLESAFLDVSRIEVARGPQGALFGKSTIAGAISVVSNKPTDEFEGNIKAGYEMENGSFNLSGALSGPLSESVSGRLAYTYEDGDGWVENPLVDGNEPQSDKTAVRASLAWEASDNTDVNLKFESGSSETNGRSNQSVSPGLFSLFSSDPSPEYVPDNQRRISTGVGREDFYEYDWSLASLTVDHQIGGHTLTGILGYWDYENQWRLDVDGVPEGLLNTDLRDKFNQTTAEVRLLSPADQTFEYILGMWYQESELNTQQYSPFRADFTRFFAGIVLPEFLVPVLGPPDSAGAVGTNRLFQRDQDAFSVYGQTTWNISDRFRAIADFRYTDETQNGVGQGRSAIFPDGVNPVEVPRQYLFHVTDYLFNQEREDDSFDPALRLQYDLSDDTVMYAGWSRGSKSGGLKANDGNLGNILLASCESDPSFCQQFTGKSVITTDDLANGLTLLQGNSVFDFEEEEAESYEIGAKMVFAGGAASLNVALYSMDFDNLQTSSYDGTQFIIQNAASASVEGFEMDGAWQASDSLRLTGSLAYVDATYDDFPGAQCVVDANGETVITGCVDGDQNLAGFTLERVPEWEANLNADWSSSLTDNIELLASLSMYYSDEYFVRPDFDLDGRQASFIKWDARLALASIDGTWEIGLTGRNLGDELVIQHAYEVLGEEFQSLGIGRTITLDGVYRF